AKLLHQQDQSVFMGGVSQRVPPGHPMDPFATVGRSFGRLPYDRLLVDGRRVPEGFVSRLSSFKKKLIHYKPKRIPPFPPPSGMTIKKRIETVMRRRFPGIP